MKSGVVVGMYDVNTQIDSIIFYKPPSQGGNTFIGPRDGNVYQTLSIGSQVWMAENLKYLPSDAEWTQLTDYLGGTAVAGGKLKEAGTAHWNEPNEGASNETGFTALPGGDRNYTEVFTDIGNFGYWWSATEYTPGYSYYRGMRYNGSNVFENYFFQKNDFSVRCVKN